MSPSNRASAFGVSATITRDDHPDHGVAVPVSRTDALRWLGDEDSHVKLLRELVAGQQLVVGYDDELAGHLADRMTATDHSRIPILSRKSGELVGLVARRDLLRVRANMMRHEREREALIRVLPRRAQEP